MQFQIIAQTDPFKLVPEESKLDDVNSEGNHEKPIKGRWLSFKKLSDSITDSFFLIWCHVYFTLCIILDVAPPISEVAVLQDAWGYDGYENEYGEYIPYTMADLEWNGYEDEVTGEWISNLVVVYDPAMSKMPKQRWHRALNKINKVNFRICIIYV